MKEVWREICEAFGLKTVIFTLLSALLIVIGIAWLLTAYSKKEQLKRQQESSIRHLITNPVQTNFTS